MDSSEHIYSPHLKLRSELLKSMVEEDEAMVPAQMEHGQKVFTDQWSNHSRSILKFWASMLRCARCGVARLHSLRNSFHLEHSGEGQLAG